MNQPLVYVAKYIPNPVRMEPKNFGVVIWDGGCVHARFLGEHSDGHVRPPKSVPEHIRHAYREWISYWRVAIAKGGIVSETGTRISKDDPQFMATMANKSNGMFMLTHSAVLHDTTNGNLPSVANEFYTHLVSPDKSDKKRATLKAHAVHLKRACTKLFRDAQLLRRKCYAARQHVVTTCDGNAQDFVFDYALGRDTPYALFQRVLLEVDKSVASTAWMFQWVSQCDTYASKPKCAAMVDSSMYDIDNRIIAGSLASLRRVGQVIDVSDPAALRQIGGMTS